MSFRARIKARDAVIKHGVDSQRLDLLTRLPKLGTWEKERVPASIPRFDHRFPLYDHLQATVLKDEPMDYLEFGVYKGESMGYWADIHANASSRFYGFDTFDGLPEAWHYFGGAHSEATFDAGGVAPVLADSRVTFVKGLFQDTVSEFLDKFEPESRIFLHCDADLYSSTLYVLTQFDRLLVPGSIVLFDEFASVMDEFSALRDYCAAYRREYDVIACTRHLAHVAIVMR
jgi:hypothetical protein